MRKIHCDLVLYPKFHDGWVVFDRWFYRGGKVIHKIIYDENASKPVRQFPSFNFQQALDYILSADKKTFRKQNHFIDSKISGSEYNERITHVAWHSESVYEVANVSFAKSLFICPISGVVWKRNEVCFQKPVPFSKKLLTDAPWRLSAFHYNSCAEILFATDRVIELLNNDRSCISGEPLGVKLWDYESNSIDATTFDPVWEKVATSTAESGFLSGVYHGEWGKYSGYRKKNYAGNPRDFIYYLFNPKYAPPVYREDIVKSAARYIKKVTRIAPLSKSTKLFFKTLGALAHLQKAVKHATQP